MQNVDALTRVVFDYIKQHNGQTILMKNMEQDTAITQTTLRKKIKLLAEKNLIKKDGKNFYILKEGN